MGSEKNFMLEELKRHLTFKDKILLHFLKGYTYRIYVKGIKKGFDWYY